MSLTDARVRNAKPKDRTVKLSDAGGLHLLITPKGSKLWRLAYRYAGKQKTLAIGAYPTITLEDAREVRTKRTKTIHTFFFPVGDDIVSIVTDWIAWLRTEHLFGEDDPLFPATRVGLNAHQKFEAVGLDRKHWRNAGAIRRIFHESFEAAGLPYFNPHSFRKTITAIGQRMSLSPEQLKSWSQNLGHDDVLTTFTSYGSVSIQRQGEIMGQLGNKRDCPEHVAPDAQLFRSFMEWSRQRSGQHGREIDYSF